MLPFIKILLYLFPIKKYGEVYLVKSIKKENILLKSQKETDIF